MIPATVNNTPAARRIASASVWRLMNFTMWSSGMEEVVEVEGVVVLGSGAVCAASSGVPLSGGLLFLARMSCIKSRYSSPMA